MFADRQKTSAQDLYGTVPIDGGGTGASTKEEALANLGVIDYIVEQGTKDISHTDNGSNLTDFWTYRKWNSGLVECIGMTFHKTLNVSSAGSFKTSHITSELPVTFINNVYNQSFSANVEEPLCSVQNVKLDANDGETCNSFTFLFVDFANALSSGENLYIRWHITGKWK